LGRKELAFESPLPEELARDLHDRGITHLLLSKPVAKWFITNHNPLGMHRQTLNYFTKTFFPSCGKIVYSDQKMVVFEIPFP
jgi:hypothetical protein